MIKELADKHKGRVLDKWESYLNTYDSILKPYQEKRLSILEIGVANGGSLDLWAEYFPNAKNIVGCDINKECGDLKYDDPRISVVVGDVNELTTFAEIQKIAETYDIIIDDGSHLCPDVIKTFALYFPLLNYNGLYIVEDLHTSYWNGSSGGLHTPLSSMAFFKRLADIPNVEHWRIKRKGKEYLKCFEQYYGIEFDEGELDTIHSITFTNSMVVINTQFPTHNKLGKRMVRGNDEHIMPNLLVMNGRVVSEVKNQAIDDWQYDPIAMINRINQLSNREQDESVKEINV